ncbi:MAG: AAA family ATPase, partial [Magnetococcales bacterium]|nr:AAA family ATPase [Magnetococcales bacterium]
FSPNLNCIIGGRGSGKSALLEGMRLAMGKDNDPKMDDRTREKVDRIRDLLTKKAGSEIRVHWRDADGIEDQLVYTASQAGSGSCHVEGRSMSDLASFLKDLPIQFFSQQQLNQITARGGNVLLTLLDEFAREELNPLRQQEAELRWQIGQLFSSIATLEQTEKDINRLRQENAELERQWQARAALQDDTNRHQGLKSEQAYMQKLKSTLDDDTSRLLAMADDICETHTVLGSATNRWVHGSWFQEKDEQILKAKEALKAEVSQVVATYRKNVLDLFENDPVWFTIQQQMAQADASLVQACTEKGLDPEDVHRIQEIGQKRALKKQELEQKERERLQLQQLLRRLPELFQLLHQNWQACYAVRQQLADDMTRSAASGDKPVIRLIVSYSSDRVAFDAIWSRLCTDRTTRLGRNWDEIGAMIYQEYLDTGHNDYPSLWVMLQSWLEHEQDSLSGVSVKLGALQITFAEVKSHLSGVAWKAWQDARLMRIEDTVDLVLYRADGHEEVGRISEGTLSDGQRNTAALAMLLAKGQHPLVIDQPEDELDSNFIFRELVPMLCRLKHSRQIILATHNPNLPVNGNAELVYALEVQKGRGVKRAEGGLDREDVTRAILDIMEGSEQAFRQRREKYHF